MFVIQSGIYASLSLRNLLIVKKLNKKTGYEKIELNNIKYLKDKLICLQLLTNKNLFNKVLFDQI